MSSVRTLTMILALSPLACAGSDPGGPDAAADLGVTDTPADAAVVDAELPDAASTDAAAPDAGSVDSGPGPLAPQWTELAGGPLPTGPRWGAAVVKLEVGEVLLLGTAAPAGATANDAWLRGNDGQWSEVVTSSVVPPPRYCHCAVALPDNRVLMTGGRDRSGLVWDAWVLDVVAATWTEVTGSLPLPGVGCHAAWHESTGRAILVEGQSRGGNLGRTGGFGPATNAFTLLRVTNPPPGRRDGSLIADPSGDRLLLYGGATVVFPQADARQLTDLWSFDGTDWTELTVDVGPAPRRYPALALSQSRQLMLLFGGTNEVMDFNDLWALDLTTLTWSELSPQGTIPSTRAAMGYVSEADGTLRVMGGLVLGFNRAFDDMWQLNLAPCRTQRQCWCRSCGRQDF